MVRLVLDVQLADNVHVDGEVGLDFVIVLQVRFTERAHVYPVAISRKPFALVTSYRRPVSRGEF